MAAEKWNTILHELRTLDECHASAALPISKVNKIHSRIVNSEKFSVKIGSKVKDFYHTIGVTANLEKRLISSLLENLKQLEDALEGAESDRNKKRKADAAGGSTLKKNRTHDEGSGTPTLSSSTGIPNNLLPRGTRVVCRPEKDFIMGIVLEWLTIEQRYEVMDADTGDDATDVLSQATVAAARAAKKTYKIAPRQLLVIPKVATREYPEGHLVLALYPGATCFYKGRVTVPPSKNLLKTHYSVLFEEDGGIPKDVPILEVLDFPKKKS
ncbi:hypothetical protein BDR26DRAFT_834149 [Obelidium mucronatum]|nr:hypothetical protein BDR26DRAFT_834149 [Obelidium mucronatum]